MLPPCTPCGANWRTQAPSPHASPYAFIASNKNLRTLKALVDQAGLADSFSTPSLNATLFLPSDDALAAFVSSVQEARRASASLTYGVAELLAEPALRMLLLNHVAPGQWTRQRLGANGTRVPTLAGETLTAIKCVRRNR